MRFEISPMLIALLFSTSICFAEEHVSDGNELYSEYKKYSQPISADTVYESAHYMGYVQGVSDATEGTLFCLPVGVKFGQIADIVGQYLEQHPEVRHQNKLQNVTAALRKAFPCAKAKR